MSNLYKGTRILNTSSVSRIIDSNEKIMSKLEAIRTPVVPANTNEKSSEILGSLEDIAVNDDQNIQEMIKKAEHTAAGIVEKANEQAKEIVDNADRQSEDIKKQAYKDGYNEGLIAAHKEVEKTIKDNENEYSKRRLELEREYEKMRSELEPQLVETLLYVFTKVTHTMADSNKDTILHLVNSVMRNTEISKHFLIKVSKEDYQFMLNSKEKLYEHVSRNVSIEIYQDSNMTRNQCIIETDAGVFDCSLDIQLENLVKELRILSCLAE